MGLFKKLGKAVKKTTGSIGSAVKKSTGSISSAVKKSTGSIGIGSLTKGFNPFKPQSFNLKSAFGTFKQISKPVSSMIKPIMKSVPSIIKPVTAIAAMNPMVALAQGKSPLAALGALSPLNALNPLNGIGDTIGSMGDKVKGFFAGFIPFKETLLIAGAAGVGGLIVFNKITNLGR